MASVNKVILVGHAGKDPEQNYLPSGDAVCNLSLATSEQWKDKASGEKKEATEWHRLVFFGKLAEIVGQYIKKGSLIYVEGSLRTRKWTDKEGQDRYSTEIKCDSMKMLGGNPASRGDSGGGEPQRQAPSQQQPGGAPDFDDDIPF